MDRRSLGTLAFPLSLVAGTLAWLAWGGAAPSELSPPAVGAQVQVSAVDLAPLPLPVQVRVSQIELGGEPPSEPAAPAAEAEVTGRLAGRVVNRVGAEGVGPGITVLAVPSRAYWQLQPQGLETLLQDPRVVVASCADDGRFEFAELDARRPYDLVAGGAGWVVPNRAENVRVGAEDVSLDAYPGFVAALDIREIGEAPVRGPMAYGGDNAGRLTMPARLGHLDSKSLTAQLAGVPERLTHKTASQALYVFWSREAMLFVDGIQYTMTRPGYERYQRLIEAGPLAHGIETIPVRLTPTSAEWGSLRIELVGGEELKAVNPGQHLAELALRPRSGHSFTVALHSLEDGGFTVPSVPAGEYRAALRLQPQTLAVPVLRDESPWIEIGSGHTVAVADLAERGSLRFELTDGERAHEGGFEFMLVEGDQREHGTRDKPLHGRLIHLAGPSFELPYVQPGRYTLALNDTSRGRVMELIEVALGKATLVSIDRAEGLASMASGVIEAGAR